MLATEIHLLDLAATAPRAAFGGRAVDDGVVVEHLVLGGDDEDAGADDAVGRQPEGVVHAGAGADGVAVADGGRFDAWDVRVSVATTGGGASRRRDRTGLDTARWPSAPVARGGWDGDTHGS